MKKELREKWEEKRKILREKLKEKKEKLEDDYIFIKNGVFSAFVF